MSIKSKKKTSSNRVEEKKGNAKLIGFGYCKCSRLIVKGSKDEYPQILDENPKYKYF
jgi:hypothetical protein